ncbi:MAG: phenylacetate--CoA ligase family protein [Polyangiaceae bacterium]|nr:phenylacetate--CoA ligase family protein [Polyangiaceae bacterium]
MRVDPAEMQRRARYGLNYTLAAFGGEAGRYAALRRAMEWTSLDGETVRRRQLACLREILGHAGRFVPYWRELFRAHGFDPTAVRGPEDLGRLPVLTKEAIRSGGERMLAENVPRGRLRERRTGGSTGEPLRFFVTRAEFEEQIGVCLRANVLVGVAPGDPIAKVWGYGRPQRIANAIAPLTGRLYLDAYRTSEADLADWIRDLVRIRPRMLYGYARALHELARYVHRNRIVVPRLGIVATTAEKLLPEHRTTIEEALGARVIDMYGAHEVPRIASECLYGRMHLAPDAAVVEFVPDGNGSSRILLTSLGHRAMPLIRYDIGDLGEPDPRPCDCGLPFPCMSIDFGKTHHILVLPSGRPLHTGYFFKRLYHLDAIDQVQIRHERPDLIVIAYVPAVGQADAAQAALGAALGPVRHDLAQDARVETRAVAEIPPTARGKRPLVVSLVDGTR